MEGIRQDTPAARYVAENLKHETFVLLDIGCSGGLDKGWRCFGDRLQAVGFDIDLDEIDKLNQSEANPLVQYLAGFVGVATDDPLRPQFDQAEFLGRNIAASLSYIKTLKLREPVQYEEAQWKAVSRDSWAPAEVANQRTAEASKPIVLTQFLAEKGLASIDFIKIDVDGADYLILQSMKDVFDGAGLLGLGVEVNYVGSQRATDNVFHNVDRLMRSKDFGLFDLSIRSYSSAALPWPYALPYPYAAYSVRGRPYQGDALYMRDGAADETRAILDGFSAEKLAKLAALFAVFNLPDQAAQICVQYREAMAAVLDVDVLLDLLALQIQEAKGGSLSYSQYMEIFHRDDPAIYAGEVEHIFQNLKTATEMAAYLGAETEKLGRQVDLLKGKLATTYALLRQSGHFRPIAGGFKSFLKSHPTIGSLPATLGTPSRAWDWGGASQSIKIASPSTLLVTVRAISGRIGVCVMTDDFAKRVSEQFSVVPDDGQVTVQLEIGSDASSVRIALYNFEDEGTSGEVEVLSAEIIEWPV